MSGIDRVVPRFDPPPTVGQWTPAQLRYLLHFYVTSEPFSEPERSSEHYRDSMALFSGNGLIEYDMGTAAPKITKRGEALVRMLLATPLPEESYADPRTGKRV